MSGFDRFAFKQMVTKTENDIRAAENRFRLLASMPKPQEVLFEIGQVVTNTIVGTSSKRKLRRERRNIRGRRGKERETAEMERRSERLTVLT